MTLRANELRIGNIVNDPSGFGPMIVEAINPSPGRVYLRSMDGEYLGDFDIAKIEGVPLTEEWLLKFGFEGDSIFGSQTLYKNQGIEVWAYRNDKTFLLDNVKRKIVYIKHVHQLQNIYFALTGEELSLANHPI